MVTTILEKKHIEELTSAEEAFFDACHEGRDSAFKTEAIEARIGKKLTGGGFSPPHELYVDHIKSGDQRLNHSAWAKVWVTLLPLLLALITVFQAIRKWFDNKKGNTYKRKGLGPAHSSEPSSDATSTALTAARQRLIRVLGEFTPLERWVDQHQDAIMQEEANIRASGAKMFGAALRSKAVSNLYTSEVRNTFTAQVEDRSSYISEYDSFSPHIACSA